MRCKPAAKSLRGSPNDSQKRETKTDPVNKGVDESIMFLLLRRFLWCVVYYFFFVYFFLFCFFSTMNLRAGLSPNCSTNYKSKRQEPVLVGAEKGGFGLDPAYSYKRYHRPLEKPKRFPPIDQFAPRWTTFAAGILNSNPSGFRCEEGLRDLRVVGSRYQRSQPEERRG